MAEHNEILPVEGEIMEAPSSALTLGSMPVTSPTELVERAVEVANALSEIIRKKNLSKKIQGRDYVYVSGWSTCGAMVGIGAREVPEMTIRYEDGSYSAYVNLIRFSDGAVIGGGGAYVGMDERDRDGKLTWGSRPEYARRSMAVTRAAGKAFRLTLAWIMELAGFAPTPAEEMDGLNLPHETDYSKPKPAQKAPQAAQDAPQGEPPAEVQEGAPEVKRPWGPSVLLSKMAYSVDARLKKNPADNQPISDDAARTIATKTGNILRGIAGTEKQRHALIQYLFGVTTSKALMVAERDALEAWLTNDPPMAREEAALVMDYLSSVKGYTAAEEYHNARGGG